MLETPPRPRGATISRLLARTAARKAAGLIPHYGAAAGAAPALAAPAPRVPALDPCVHQGPATGEQVECPTCVGRVTLKVFACGRYGTCTLGKPVPGVRGCCRTCPDYQPKGDGTSAR